MKRKEATEEISSFRNAVQVFDQLLLDSRDDVIPEIVRNHEEVARQRSALVRTRARLQKYVNKFGINPRMRDGVNPEYYPVYDNAFSTDILQRVGPSLDMVLQDLDHILGSLDGMSDVEFDSLLAPPQTTHGIIATGGGGGGGGGGPGGGRGGDGGGVVIGIPPEHVTIQHVKDIHSQYWRKVVSDIWLWFKEHVLTAVVVGLIIAGVVYSLGWN